MNRGAPSAFLAAAMFLTLAVATNAQQAEGPTARVAGSPLVLKDGLDVNLKFAEDISSRSVAVDDPITLTLDDDLKVGDVVVVKAGAKAYAIVSNVKKAGLLGKGAELNIRLDYLKADNAKIKLRGAKSREGEDKTNKAIALAIVLDGVATVDAMKPYTAQLAIGGEVAAELESSFITLLDGTADHYRAAVGALEPLSKCCLDKALEFIAMFNTQARKDRALTDVIDWICQGRAPEIPVGSVRTTLSLIDDPFIRGDAVALAIHRLSEDRRRPPKVDGDLRMLLVESMDIRSASTRCHASAEAYVLVRNFAAKDWDDLAIRLLAELRSAWASIDLGWLRVRTGFEIAERFAPLDSELLTGFLKETEILRSELGGLANHDAARSYELCIQLASRAFSGLVHRQAYASQDIELLAVLIEAVPGAGRRAVLWSDLALECARAGRGLCCDLVNGKVRPLLAGIPAGDKEYKEFIISRVAPALFEANSASALGMIEALQLLYRDSAYSNIVDFLFRGELVNEPEDYIPGAGYNVEYSRLLQVCEVVTLMDSDDQIFDAIEKLVDCITSKKLTIAYSNSQKEEVYRRIQTIISVKLPAARHIRHDGYKVIARARLARFRNDPDVADLDVSARRIPNTADRALVMFDTGLAIAKTSRNLADELINDARKLVATIPSDWDRLGRMIGFAQEAQTINKMLSRQLLEEAIKTMPNVSDGRGRSLRRIVDLAHKIDAGFAKALVDKLDDDPARKKAQRQIEVLDLKQKLIDEKPVYEELQVASTAEYQKLGAMLLGALQSDRMSSVRPKFIRPCIQAAARQPIKEAYWVMAWIIQNSVEKHASSDKAALYLRPIFEATLAGAELAGQLANKSFAELRASQEQYGARLESKGRAVEVYGPDQARRFVTSWLENNAKGTVIVCDPMFSGEDLLIVQLIRAVDASCQVDIITSRPTTPAPDGLSWDTFYTSQWREISEQSPPPTRIVMIGATANNESPLRISCLLSGDVGLDLGGSIRSLSVQRPPILRHMEFGEVDALRKNVQALLTGRNEWEGIKVRFSSFSL